MGRDLRLQFIDQFFLHECVVIWNVKGHHVLSIQRIAKFQSQLVRVRTFHAEDNVGPSYVAFRDNYTRFGLCAGGANLQTWRAFKDLFGSQAPKAVPAADKEDLGRSVAGHE